VLSRFLPKLFILTSNVVLASRGGRPGIKGSNSLWSLGARASRPHQSCNPDEIRRMRFLDSASLHPGYLGWRSRDVAWGRDRLGRF